MDFSAVDITVIFSLFFSTCMTLIAVINPFETLPVYMGLTRKMEEKDRRMVARNACFYAFLLIMFFLCFGTFVMKVFGVSLDMIKIAGGIVLTKIGFELFTPSSSGSIMNMDGGSNIAFMPLAIPLLCGPGVIATVISMMATVKESQNVFASFLAIVLAIFIAMLVTYLCLYFAEKLVKRLGQTGIDAITRIVGFFVSAMGVSLVFSGVIHALQHAQTGLL